MLIEHNRRRNGRTAIYCGPKKNFKSQLSVYRETLEVILGGISQLITKTPTNFLSNLMKVHRRVALPSSNIIKTRSRLQLPCY